MTLEQWYALAAELQARWPHREIPEESVKLWYEDLSSLPSEEARAAILALYRDGREWAPNGAQILAKVSELRRQDPHYGEAWKLVNQALMKYGVYDWPSFYSCLPPAVSEAARRMNFEIQGGYLKAQESTVRAQFRDVFQAVCEERRRTDAYADIPGITTQQGPRKLGEAFQRVLDSGPDACNSEAEESPSAISPPGA